MSNTRLLLTLSLYLLPFLLKSWRFLWIFCHLAFFDFIAETVRDREKVSEAITFFIMSNTILLLTLLLYLLPFSRKNEKTYSPCVFSREWHKIQKKCHDQNYSPWWELPVWSWQISRMSYHSREKSKKRIFGLSSERASFQIFSKMVRDTEKVSTAIFQVWPRCIILPLELN